LLPLLTAAVKTVAPRVVEVRLHGVVVREALEVAMRQRVES
jgi:hypothetical protein